MPKKSALAEHADEDHAILFEDTQTRAPARRYVARMYKEGIGIFKHQNNLNRRGEVLRRTGYVILHYRETRMKGWEPRTAYLEQADVDSALIDRHLELAVTEKEFWHDTVF